MEIENNKPIAEQQSDTGEAEGMTQDYVATIKELKQNSVDRSKYEELRAENKKLLEAIASGQEVEVPQGKQRRTAEEIRKEMFSADSDLNNLEYVQDALELRERVLEEDGVDIFLPNGTNYTIKESDVEAANRVASVYKDCVEQADGDNVLFTALLQNRIVDNNPIAAAKSAMSKNKR